MKNGLFFLLIAFTPAISFAQGKVINDPNVQVRKVSSFHAIKVGGSIDLYLTQSDEEAVAVSAISDEIRDRIRTEVINGELRIWFDWKGKWWKEKGRKKLKAYVSCKSLDKLEGGGASDIMLTGLLKSDNLFIRMSGASDLKGEQGEIKIGNLDMTLS